MFLKCFVNDSEMLFNNFEKLSNDFEMFFNDLFNDFAPGGLRKRRKCNTYTTFVASEASQREKPPLKKHMF